MHKEELLCNLSSKKGSFKFVENCEKKLLELDENYKKHKLTSEIIEAIVLNNKDKIPYEILKKNDNIINKQIKILDKEIIKINKIIDYENKNTQDEKIEIGFSVIPHKKRSGGMFPAPLSFLVR